MKAKIKATGQIINVFRKEYTSGAVAYIDTNIPDCSPFYHPYREDDLDFDVPETCKEAKENAKTFAFGNENAKESRHSETAVLEGYVARDANGDLNLFRHKPGRVDNIAIQGWLSAAGSLLLLLDEKSFPSVTWESEPKKVRITLESIEE